MGRAKTPRLSIKRQKFVSALVATGNQTAAARAAGYASPIQEGSRLIRFADVAAAVQARLEKAMSSNEAQARLALMAEGKIPTKVVKGMSPKGPMRRVEYDTKGATETVAKIHKLLTDGAEPPKSTINVAVVLPQIPAEQIDALLGYLERAKAIDVEATA